jgi:hypothetical protein
MPSSWYRRKAAGCERQALRAHSLESGAGFQRDAVLWKQIADQIDAREQAKRVTADMLRRSARSARRACASFLGQKDIHGH